MVKKQKATKGNVPPKIDDKIKNPFDVLDEKDQIYVNMAVQGFTHLHIAEKAKRAHITVRKWFSIKGRLHDAYKYRLSEHRKEYDEKFKEIDQIIKDSALDSILLLAQTVKKALKSGSSWPSDIKAATDTLDRAGFNPTQKIDNLTPKTDEKMLKQVAKIEAYVKSTIARSSKSNP